MNVCVILLEVSIPQQDGQVIAFLNLNGTIGNSINDGVSGLIAYFFKISVVGQCVCVLSLNVVGQFADTAYELFPILMLSLQFVGQFTSLGHNLSQLFVVGN